MYKALTIIYVVCFFWYLLFSRVPDFFDGELTPGTVSQATFSVKDKHPQVVVNYRVGSETYQYITDTWFLTSYKPGQRVMVIYDPTNPSVSGIYAFIGYWIHWSELLCTVIFFIILFIVASSITGKNRDEPSDNEMVNKRKYDI